MKTLLSFSLLTLIFLNLAHAVPANTCKLDITLSPAGSYTASSSSVQVLGGTEKKGAQFLAHQVSLDLNTLDSGKPLRDEHMQKKYLETDKYPKAVLTEAVGENGKFKGDLLMHGVKNPVAGEYKIVGDRFIANFKTHISDYKIQKVKYMGVGVDDEVAVEINISAKPTGPLKAVTTK